MTTHLEECSQLFLRADSLLHLHELRKADWVADSRNEQSELLVCLAMWRLVSFACYGQQFDRRFGKNAPLAEEWIQNPQQALKQKFAIRQVGSGIISRLNQSVTHSPVLPKHPAQSTFHLLYISKWALFGVCTFSRSSFSFMRNISFSFSLQIRVDTTQLPFYILRAASKQHLYFFHLLFLFAVFFLGWSSLKFQAQLQ
jgi:hypothetical protein